MHDELIKGNESPGKPLKIKQERISDQELRRSKCNTKQEKGGKSTVKATLKVESKEEQKEITLVKKLEGQDTSKINSSMKYLETEDKQQVQLKDQ